MIHDDVATYLKFTPPLPRPVSPIFTPFDCVTGDMFHHVNIITGKTKYILCVYFLIQCDYTSNLVCYLMMLGHF